MNSNNNLAFDFEELPENLEEFSGSSYSQFLDALSLLSQARHRKQYDIANLLETRLGLPLSGLESDFEIVPDESFHYSKGLNSFDYSLLNKLDLEFQSITVKQIWVHLFEGEGFPDRGSEMRIGDRLKKLGWEKTRRVYKGKKYSVWYHPKSKAARGYEDLSL